VNGGPRLVGDRQWGTGRVFQRKGTPNWWRRYPGSGQYGYESSRLSDRNVAERLLEDRLRERDRNRAVRQKRRAAQLIFERFSKLTLVELLTESVRSLATEMRRLDRPVPGVYFVRSGGFITIGFANNLDVRIGGLQVGNPTAIELLAMLPGPRSLERRLHSLFGEHRERGEWFRVNDRLTDFLTSLRAIYGPEALDQKEPSQPSLFGARRTAE